MNDYQRRRQQLFDQLTPGDVGIVCSAEEVSRNHDAFYPYRQDSQFHYLTGFPEPEAIALFIPGRAEGEYILFNRPNNPEQERWTGKRSGQAGACKKYFVDQSYPIEEFDERLKELLLHTQRVFLPFSKHNKLVKQVFDTIDNLHPSSRKGEAAPYELINIAPIVDELRLKKSAKELDYMRYVAKISAQAHRRAMQVCEPGLFEYQLEAELLHDFMQAGCRFPAYESIVAGGANACVLHYVANTSKLKANELVLIDAGAEFNCYAADITRTFPVNGHFNQEQAALYDVVLAAQMAAIDIVKPGLSWRQLQEVILVHITQGLLDLGILQGELNELIETEAYKPFYMHGSGHWLGLDVHDAGAYKIKDKWRMIEENMVFTIEPGIYIDGGSKHVDPKWWNTGIRIEDDIVATHDGYEVLSSDAPKLREDIEKTMRQ